MGVRRRMGVAAHIRPAHIVRTESAPMCGDVVGDEREGAALAEAALGTYRSDPIRCSDSQPPANERAPRIVTRSTAR